MVAHLEFHDSDLLASSHQEADLVLELDAYVHRWEAIDGVWKGTGWMRRVRVLLRNSTGLPEVDAPIELSSGTVRAGSDDHYNLVPFPFLYVGQASIELELVSGHKVSSSGDGIELAAAGKARYIELLPDEFAPDTPAKN